MSQIFHKSELLRLVRQYGRYCSEASYADARDHEKRYKLCDDKSTEILEQIEAAINTLPLCTGVSASWCPIHGDCSCVEGSENYHNDDNCPLHSGSSNHADGVHE